MYIIFKSQNFSELKDKIKTIPKNETALSLRHVLSPLTSLEIREIFKLIPPHISHLDLSNIYSETPKARILRETLNALPSTITSINLKGNRLGMREIELEEIIKALPRTVISLNLGDNHLYRRTTQDLAQAFEYLPPGLISLDISQNELLTLLNIAITDPSYIEKCEIEKIDLEKVFKALPPHITSLNLFGNDLGALATKELITAFKSLPSSLKSLNLESNYLGNKNSIELKQIFEVFPRSITKLNLAIDSCIYFKTSEDSKQRPLLEPPVQTLKDFEQAFKVLPSEITDLNLKEVCYQKYDQPLSLKNILNNFPHLRSLDLSGNELSKKMPGVELVNTLKALPKDLTHLDLQETFLKDIKDLNVVMTNLPPLLTSLNLSINFLYDHDVSELKRVFKALPRSLTSLELFGNDFGRIKGSVEKIFKALPDSLVKLDLGGNSLNKKTTKELSTLFKSLPSSLAKLNLTFNDLGEKSAKELATIFKSLPKSIESLNLEANHLEEKTAEELKIICQSLPKNLKKIYLSGSFSGEQLFGIAEGLKDHILLTKLNGITDAIDARPLYAILERNCFSLEKNKAFKQEQHTARHGIIGFFKDKFKSISCHKKLKKIRIPEHIFTARFVRYSCLWVAAHKLCAPTLPLS